MDCREVIGEPTVGRMLPQGGLEPVGCGVPLGRQATDGHSVAGDHDSLAVLDRVEQAGEVPRRVGGSDSYHDYRVSDNLRIYAKREVRRSAGPLHAALIRLVSNQGCPLKTTVLAMSSDVTTNTSSIVRTATRAMTALQRPCIGQTISSQLLRREAPDARPAGQYRSGPVPARAPCRPSAERTRQMLRLPGVTHVPYSAPMPTQIARAQALLDWLN